MEKSQRPKDSRRCPVCPRSMDHHSLLDLATCMNLAMADLWRLTARRWAKVLRP